MLNSALARVSGMVDLSSALRITNHLFRWSVICRSSRKISIVLEPLRVNIRIMRPRHTLFLASGGRDRIMVM